MGNIRLMNGKIPAKSLRARDMLHAFRANLAAELANRKLDMKAASLAAGLNHGFVRDVLERKRNPQLSYVIALAQAHRLSIDHLLGLAPATLTIEGPVKIRGIVAAGVWREAATEGERDADSPLPPDPRYPLDAQYDLVVRGNSINRFARDGELLRVVDLQRTRQEFYDNDMVIIRRTRDGGQLIQVTAARVRRRGPVLELFPDSDDPRWQDPERIDTRHTKPEEAAIVALVLHSFKPVRTPGERRAAIAA